MCELIDDGFVRHKHDLEGLFDTMRGMGIAEPGDVLLPGDSAPWEEGEDE